MISVDVALIPNDLMFASKHNLKKLLFDRKNYQNSIKTINVVGTNGKGSTSFYVSQGLKEKYNKVGLFSSPAFLYHNERIQINNIPISDADLVRITMKNKADCIKYELNWFEVWTLIAIDYFIENKVDIAVIEAGIGGMLDSTNCFANQEAVLLTSVSFDHTEILGNKIEDIIYQKLKISRIGTKVFIANNNKEHLPFIKSILNNEIILSELYDDEIEYQKYNKGLAKAVLEFFDVNKIEEVLNLDPPLGRFTTLRNKPKLIIDGGHNIDGIKKMTQTIKNMDEEFVVLFASSKGKEHKEMLNYLKEQFDKVYITSFVHLKSWNTKAFDEYESIDNWKEFLLNTDKNVIVCGSLYFIPQVYDWFVNEVK